MPNITEEEAHASLRRSRFEALEPYPGKVVLRWRVRCLVCGTASVQRLSEIRARNTSLCPQCLSCQRALRRVAYVRAEGYLPLEPYPGAVRAPWRLGCVACDGVYVTSYQQIRSGQELCPHRVEFHRLRRAWGWMRGNGYEPQEPYPGTPASPWRLRCLRCGGQARLTQRQVTGERGTHACCIRDAAPVRRQPAPAPAPVPAKPVRRRYDLPPWKWSEVP